MATDEEFPSLKAAAATPSSKKGKDKKQKLILSEFSGSCGGSWADEVIETLPTAPAASRGDDYSARSRVSDGRGAYSDRDSFHASRQHAPLPATPPFTAYVGNLPYDTTDQELGNLFRGVTHVRLVRDRDGKSKGFAYVEFKSVEDLNGGLSLDNMSFGGRSLRVNVAEPCHDRPEREDRTDVASWRRAAPVDLPRGPRNGDRGSFGSGFGGGFGGTSGGFAGGRGAFGDRRSSGSFSWGNAPFGDRRGSCSSFGDRHRPDFAAEREWRRSSEDNLNGRRGLGDHPPREPSRFIPSSAQTFDRPFANNYRTRGGHSRDSSDSAQVHRKLILQPRFASAALPSEGPAAGAPVTRSKPNPFGQAKPRDENKALHEVEERRRRREEEQRRRAAESKSILSTGSAKD